MNHKPIANFLPLLAVLGSSLLLSSCITSESGDISLFTSRADGSSYQISGLISAEAATAVDSDINDIYADYESNDTSDTAQEISNLVTVQGFASASGSNGLYSDSTAVERFSDAGDTSDFYSLTLQAGQSISMTVVDTPDANSNFSGDLDLYLYDADGDLVSKSDSARSSTETVSATTTGSHFLEVRAYNGISKYLLSINAASSHLSNVSSAFVTGEVVVEYDETLISASQISALSLERSGLQVSQRRGGDGRPALLTLTTSANSTSTGRQLASSVTNSSSGSQSSSSSVSAVQQRIEEQRATLIAIKELAQQEGVLYAEPNYIRQAFTVPNDTRYPMQWHFESIALPSAWELTDGSPAEGDDDVIVAVLDTGVFMTHTDLVNQLTDSGYDFVSSSSRSNDGDGIDDDPTDPGDSTIRGYSSWHGTHVSGIIAAETNNSRGVAGISWGAKIMPVRVLGLGGGTSYDIIQGIYYAAGLENDSGTVPDQAADIINLSLGSTASSSAEFTAITAAYEAGAILVAASGNSGTSAKNYPASYDGVLSVTATDFDHEVTSYSNYGSAVDVAAPGGDTSVDANLDGSPDGIYSTLVDDSTSTRRASYGFYNGTSMAAPHVAGVLALMKAVYPELSPTLVETLLAGGLLTDDLGTTGRDDYYGWGEINAFTAVAQAMSLASGDTVELPAIPSLSPSAVTAGTDETATISISNLGGDTLTVESVAVDADWMTVAASAVDSDGLGDYLISFDRTDLAVGYYTGTLTFDTSEGSLEAEVVITVGDLTDTGELTRQYVIVMDAEDDSYVAETRVSSDGIFSVDVPAGTYYLYAGSDIDVDYYICTAGETCGAYPSLNSRSSITVNAARSDLNFSVSIQSSGEIESSNISTQETVINSGILRQDP